MPKGMFNDLAEIGIGLEVIVEAVIWFLVVFWASEVV